MPSYVDLMRDMVAASDAGPAIYQPGPYWKAHADAMIEVVARSGMEKFRSSTHKALSAFATGSAFAPNKSVNPLLWRLHGIALRTPLLSRVARAYEREIITGYRRARDQANHLAYSIHALLREIAPELLDINDGLAGAPDTYETGGKVYSTMFLTKLLDVAMLRRHLDLSKVNTVLEIGGSYGVLGEILLKLYPHMKYTLLDLAPVSAFAEYSLSKNFPGQVMGYRDTAAAPEKVGVDERYRAFICCAYQLDALDGRPVDLIINAGSFQEMAREQVTNYIEFAKRNAAHVFLDNRHTTKPMGHGFEFYRDSLQPMRLAADWQNILHPGYHPALFSR